MAAGHSQLSVTSFEGIQCPLLASKGIRHTCGAYSYMQIKHTHKRWGRERRREKEIEIDTVQSQFCYKYNKILRFYSHMHLNIGVSKRSGVHVCTYNSLLEDILSIDFAKHNMMWDPFFSSLAFSLVF